MVFVVNFQAGVLENPRNIGYLPSSCQERSKEIALVAPAVQGAFLESIQLESSHLNLWCVGLEAQNCSYLNINE